MLRDVSSDRAHAARPDRCAPAAPPTALAEEAPLVAVAVEVEVEVEVEEAVVVLAVVAVAKEVVEASPAELAAAEEA